MDLQSYWDRRIDSEGRFSSIGHIAYPERINRYRKEAAKRPIREACNNYNITLDGARVLDAGCGTGIYSVFYADHNADVSGFDFSESGIKAIQARDVPGNYTVQELPDIKYDDNSFDIVHCFSVLYHLVDDDAWAESIHQLARVTAPNGKLFFRIEWTPDSGVATPHNKHRSQAAYTRVFEDAGLRVLDTYEIHDTPVWPRLARYAPWLVTSLDLFRQNPSNKLVVLEPV